MIAKTIAYLKVHYREEITLQTLAKKMFISPNYLGRIFREEMGCKFSDWLNHYRIDCAMELIKTTEMRTMDIAEAVGFGNYNIFQCVSRNMQDAPSGISALRTEENCRNKIKLEKGHTAMCIVVLFL